MIVWVGWTGDAVEEGWLLGWHDGSADDCELGSEEGGLLGSEDLCPPQRFMRLIEQYEVWLGHSAKYEI